MDEAFLRRYPALPHRKNTAAASPDRMLTAIQKSAHDSSPVLAAEALFAVLSLERLPCMSPDREVCDAESPVPEVAALYVPPCSSEDAPGLSETL